MGKILLSGYYGFNNLGDEAILEAIISNLKKEIKDTKITVLSAKPQITKEKYGVDSVNRRSILKIINAIKNCDLLISGGGSLLQDITSKRSIHYYLGIIVMGLLMGKKIMIYSQGIGPINKKSNRIITKFLLNRVEYITVRDEESKKDLLDMGVKDSKIEVTADPVITINKSGKEKGIDILKKHNGALEGNPIIGISFRGKNYNIKMKKLLIDVVESLRSELKAEVVFIPFHYNEDMELMEDLEQELRNKAIFIKDRYDIKEILSVVENLDLLVGVRLHSLIFSAVAGVPMIGISYDPKIDYFMETMGLQSLCTIDEMTKDKVIDSIKDVLDNKDIYDTKINQKVKMLRTKIALNEEKVRELL